MFHYIHLFICILKKNSAEESSTRSIYPHYVPKYKSIISPLPRAGGEENLASALKEKYRPGEAHQHEWKDTVQVLPTTLPTPPWP